MKVVVALVIRHAHAQRRRVALARLPTRIFRRFTKASQETHDADGADVGDSQCCAVDEGDREGEIEESDVIEKSKDEKYFQDISTVG